MILSSLYNLYRLKKNQWLGTSELEEVQQRKLHRIIKHAYENVKYYRRLFDSAGVIPEEIKTVDDLSKIPITTKSQLQRLSLNDIVARELDPEKCVKIRTSGSTGIPFDIIRTKAETQFFNTVWIRSFMENGLKLMDKRASIRPPGLHTTRYWFEHLGIMRKTCIYYDENSKPLEALQKANPDIIVSDPDILKLLALELRKKKNMKTRTRAIFSSALLLDSETRAFIESAFRLRVFDYYAAHEFGLLAWECSQHEGYHLNVDTVIVEFIWNGKRVVPGEWGELICTGLCSYAMPFIRYKIGDIGTHSENKCSCGRGLPIMGELIGRSDDLIKLPSGKMIHSAVFCSLMRGVKGIKQYRIIQEKIDKLMVYLVKEYESALLLSAQVREKIKKVLQEDICVKICMVDRIPRDPSWKPRSVISKVGVNEVNL